MKQPADVIADWIERVNTEGINLSEWETLFMESISEQFEDRGTLSDKQIDLLEGIYARRTP